MIGLAVDAPAELARLDARFPYLRFVSDETRELGRTLGLLDHGAMAPGGAVVYAPTIIVTDADGVLAAIERPADIATRLDADEVVRLARAAARGAAGEGR